MDVRFLPNPHYIPELRPLTGKDEPVYEYVMSFPETEEFYQQFSTLLQTIMPGYVKEGKSSLTVAIGCTGANTVQLHYLSASVRFWQKTIASILLIATKISVKRR